MHPTGEMTALARKRETLRARIRLHRGASAGAAERVFAPLRWLELVLRWGDFFRR